MKRLIAIFGLILLAGCSAPPGQYSNQVAANDIATEPPEVVSGPTPEEITEEKTPVPERPIEGLQKTSYSPRGSMDSYNAGEEIYLYPDKQPDNPIRIKDNKEFPVVGYLINYRPTYISGSPRAASYISWETKALIVGFGTLPNSQDISENLRNYAIVRINLIASIEPSLAPDQWAKCYVPVSYIHHISLSNPYRDMSKQASKQGSLLR